MPMVNSERFCSAAHVFGHNSVSGTWFPEAAKEADMNHTILLAADNPPKTIETHTA
jgi:hypothetical protein